MSYANYKIGVGINDRSQFQFSREGRKTHRTKINFKKKIKFHEWFILVIPEF